MSSRDGNGAQLGRNILGRSRHRDSELRSHRLMKSVYCLRQSDNMNGDEREVAPLVISAMTESVVPVSGKTRLPLAIAVVGALSGSAVNFSAWALS